MIKDVAGFWSYRSNLPNDIYHIFLGDWDTHEQPKRGEREWMIETPHGWHIVRKDHLSILELLSEQERRGCCGGFITSTVINGYAQLRIYGTIYQTFKEYAFYKHTVGYNNAI